ncbi:MAG: hypothetical protein Kow0031_05880 [Anaerolineae bacterium]
MTVLKQTLPRPAPRTPSDGSFESLLLVVCVLWISGSLLAMIFAAFTVLPTWYRYGRLQQAGQITTGRLIRQDLGLNWAIILYEFNLKAETFTGQQVVPLSRFEDLPPGVRLPVRYLPDNPRISALEPYHRPPALPPLLFVVFGGLAIIGGLVFLPGRWRAWHTIYRWRTQGVVTRAKIINRWRAVDEHDRDLYCLAYQFWPDAAGQPLVAAENNRAAFAALQIGDSHPVRYLPARPQVCFLEFDPLRTE